MNKNLSQLARGEFIYNCILCKYTTDNPANGEIHQKAHNQENGNAFKCTLCNYSSNLKFVVIRHMNRDHHYPNDLSSSLENQNTTDEKIPDSYLKAKGMGGDMNQFELVDLTDDCDEITPKENLLRSCPKNLLLNQQEHSIELDNRRQIEIEEAECRKRISQSKEEIRLARISMTEIRVKVKKRKEILSEKRKQKDLLSHCLELIKINNQKLTDLSINSKKLELFRIRIKDTNTKKLQCELQLREMQLQELKSKKKFYEHEDDIAVFRSDQEKAIKGLKNNFKEIKKELKSLKEKERVLVSDAELMNQCLQVVVQIPDQVLQGLQLEIEELEKGISTSLQDEMEDVFNQLIISTEEKIRNLTEMKNNLLDIIFLKKSIRRITDD